jgi:hypothetical protein
MAKKLVATGFRNRNGSDKYKVDLTSIEQGERAVSEEYERALKIPDEYNPTDDNPFYPDEV